MRSPLAPSLLALLLAPCTLAQDLLHEISGTGPKARAYHAIGLGDLNADGFGDFAIGSPGENSLSGVIRVLSGRDAALLWRRDGAAGDGLGYLPDRIPDLDGDGVAELAVGAPSADLGGVDTGAAFVYSGANGALLRTFLGTETQGVFGLIIRNVGDADADGVRDFAISAPLGADFRGRVHLFSGATGAELHRWEGALRGTGYGESLDGVGDVDGDGHDDVAVGAFFANGPGGETWTGRVWVYSGADGSVLHDLVGKSSSTFFGRAIEGVGDHDRDGRGDFLVGAPGEDGAQHSIGAVHLISGATGTDLLRMVGKTPGAGFGGFVAALGDANGDGLGDFAVGADFDSITQRGAGSATLFSGRSGQRLYRWDGREEGEVAALVHRAGDLSGDGLADVLVGSAEYGLHGDGPEVGTVRAYSGNDLFLQANIRRRAEGERLWLWVREGAPRDPALLAVVEVNGAPLFQVVCGEVFPLDADGKLLLGGKVPPGLAGITLGFLGATAAAGGAQLTSIERVVFE